MRIKWQPGEANTQIYVKNMTDPTATDQQGYPCPVWSKVWNDPIPCRWVNAHGTEAWQTAQLELKEAATVTLRYTPLITVRSRVWKASDPQDEAHAWEVISMDNVQERGELLQLKLRRVVTA